MNKQTKNVKHWAQYTSNFLKKNKVIYYCNVHVLYFNLITFEKSMHTISIK